MMTDPTTPERPVLWGEVGPAVRFKLPPGGGKTVDLPSRSTQGKRLGRRFQKLDEAFADQATLTESLGAHDPQLVIVFEGIDERIDLMKVAELAGLEILSESERDFAPDPDFPRKTVNKDLPVTGCLHAVCVNEQAMATLLRQWRKWQRNEPLGTGYAPLRDLFAHLKDVRPWGPQDRVRISGLVSALSEMLPGDHSIEIELWYRGASALRRKAEKEVGDLLTAAGGRVIASRQIDEVGYHGMKCTVPLDLLQRLASGDFDAIAAVKSSHVMYLRATSQSHSFTESSLGGPPPTSPLPEGNPVLCVLDGVPTANHPLLRDRVIVFDPDDLASSSSTQTDLRRHGTAMTSVSVWGDLSGSPTAAERPILVRPILTPALTTQHGTEEIAAAELVPDLMKRVFRELYEGTGGQTPIGESVVVINLSVGDPSTPFDGVISSWARALDWLSAEYGVLIVVSAGNHGALSVPLGAGSVTALGGQDRANLVNTLVAESFPRRSLLSPGESLNALTVGALNSDAGTGSTPSGYTFDPSDGESIVNPSSAIGSGHRRSVKPDLVAPGGRLLYHLPMSSSETELRPAVQTSRGPGIAVASPTGGMAFTTGTSPAAAAVSRSAARVVDTILSLTDRQLTRSELAVATKAMITHTTRIPEGLSTAPELLHYTHGYGAAMRDISTGCESHEASVLYISDIGADEQRELSFPLPDGLAVRGIKRVTATLAWLSPVNWRHRQYRRAVLEFSKPAGFTDLGTARDVGGDLTKRGTLQHVVWEINKAVGVGHGNTLDLTVRCKQQAGGLRGERVNFAVVLSLWVAPELGVDVYSQVKQQVAAGVAVTATP